MSAASDVSRVAPKVDAVTIPCIAVLIACVLAAAGQSRHSELLMWQLPLALVAASCLWVGVRAWVARRKTARA